MSTDPSITRLAAGLCRILAPNPSPMTERGTNTYVVGDRTLAVIDPGPDDPRHLDTLLAEIAGRKVAAILVTHAHRDHSALAPALSAATAAPILAFGGAAEGRSPRMERLASDGIVGGGEGVDRDFAPDLCLADGESISAPDWTITALHTPGHMGGHLCFRWKDDIFSGDLVMGWASTLISPPDGDLAQFRASLSRLRQEAPGRLLPGHGAPVEAPLTRIDALAAHRAQREAEILAALVQGPATPAELAARIYRDTPPALLPAAARNVLAHLIDLSDRALVLARPAPAPDASFHLA